MERRRGETRRIERRPHSDRGERVVWPYPENHFAATQTAVRKGAGGLFPLQKEEEGGGGNFGGPTRYSKCEWLEGGAGPPSSSSPPPHRNGLIFMGKGNG